MRRVVLTLVALSMTICSLAQEHEQMSKVKASPQFEQMKKLVGSWEGTFGGHPSKADFRLTGDGSALMQVLAPGTPYEMVTMFHMDGDRLMATHYCAGHNQPRLVAVPGTGSTVDFKFLDGTNIAPGDSRMDQLKVTVADADHHKELWTSTQDGKASSMEFEFHRVK